MSGHTARVSLIAGCTLALFMRVPFAVAQSNSLIDLGTNVTAYGINASGQITGCAPAGGATVHAFIYENGTTTDLGTLGGAGSCGFAINAGGQVAGYSQDASGVPFAFLYASGSMTNLGSLPASTWPGSTSAPGSIALALNDSGEVAGAAAGMGIEFDTNFYRWMQDADNSVLGGPAGFLYSGGTMTQVLQPPSPVNGAWLVLTGINDAGTLIGTQTTGTCGILCPQSAALIISNGVKAPLTNYFFAVPTGINAAGQVAGYGEDDGGNMHGFFASKGTTTDLGLNTEAYALNGAGQIVGLSNVGLHHDIGLNAQAVLFSSAGVASLNIPGAVPSGINDNGWIIANHPTLRHAYLLRPSAVSLAPSGVSFGSQSAASASVKLMNGASAAIAVMPLAPMPAPFTQSNNCPPSLAPGASCEITVSATAVNTTVISALSVTAGGTTYVTLLSDAGTIPVTVTASAATAKAGSAISLSWTSTSGALCTASGGNGGQDGWTGSLDESGARNVTETMAGSYTFTVSCSSNAGTGAGSASLKVTSASVGSGGGGGSIDLWTLMALGFTALLAYAARPLSSSPAQEET
jgi:probable HAF family extracellular repeat protein